MYKNKGSKMKENIFDKYFWPKQGKMYGKKSVDKIKWPKYVVGS